MNFISSPHILWVQEAEHILLTHTETQRSWQLRGERAFVWDMLCQHHEPRRIVEMLAHLDAEGDAAAVFHALISEWHKDGILIPE